MIRFFNYYSATKLSLFFGMWIAFSCVMAQETRIKINDSGALLSTYDFTNNESAKQEIRNAVGEKLLQEIINYSHESSWPSGIATLEARNQNRSRINEYYASFVTNVEDFSVLRIPASKNDFQPSNMRPSRDIFFIIGKYGIEEMPNLEKYVPNDNPIEEQKSTADSEGEAQQVKIIAPTEMYGTYNLKEDDEARKLVVGAGILNEEQFTELDRLTQESSWPSGINSFSGREQNRNKIKDYKAYMALDYMIGSQELILVYIPAKENQFMSSEMRPSQDFYIMFKRKGVEYLGGKEVTSHPISQQKDDFQPSVSIEDATDFSSQLNLLLESLHNNFEDLKGDERKKELMLGKEYDCLVHLEGAKDTYLNLPLLSQNLTLVASYGEYKDKEEALKIFKQLRDKVQETTFPCCTLVQDESENEMLTTSYWLPFDITGKMHPSMKDLVMEVQLMKTLGITDDFKTYDSYMLVLRIYHQD